MGGTTQSSLHKAVEQNDVGAVRTLLSQKVDVNAKEGRITSLHLAAKNGNEEILKLLLDSSTDVNVKDDNGYTPLHAMVAYFDGNIETLKMLLDSGADVNAKSSNADTILHLAVEINKAALVEYLLSRGAEVDLKDQYGNTPLHIAAQLNKNDSHLDTAAALLKYGADIHAQDNNDEVPLFHLLRGTTEQAEKTEIYKLFLKHSIQIIDKKNYDQRDDTFDDEESDEKNEKDVSSTENKESDQQIVCEEADVSHDASEEDKCKRRSWEKIDRKIEEIYEEIKNFKKENSICATLKLALMHSFLLLISILSYSVYSSLA